jgi:ribonuclease P protein component
MKEGGLSVFLKKKHEYDQVKADGAVVRNPFFTLLISWRPDYRSARIGIVVGRRVGKAVIRNRLKRKFRALVRDVFSDMSSGYHCIVYPKVTVLQAKHQEVGKAWRSTLSRKGVLASATNRIHT